MRSIQRVLRGTTDLSEDVNDFSTDPVPFAYTEGEYVYVGAEVPFNQLWIEPGAPNAAAASISVDVWWAQRWAAVVDLADGTKTGSASLAKAGRVQWALDQHKGWDSEYDSARIEGLEGTAIYGMYWLRLSWNASLTGSTTLKYVGQKFSTDGDLFGRYPDLNKSALMTSFKTGKTDWNDQAYMAAEIIARDLMARKIILARGQIFDHSRMLEPSVHKTAELIYRGFGMPYEPMRQRAERDYEKAMNKDFFRVDRDRDGRLSDRDKRHSTSWMTR